MATPSAAPTAYVAPSARMPPATTRITARRTGAPPNLAPAPPVRANARTTATAVTGMRAAVGAGRIDTVADEHTPEAMGRDPRVDRHGGEVYVYRRTGQPCLVCGTEIRTTMLEGRTMYWCPRCQRRKTAAP